MGKEGRLAVRCSDFTFARFRFHHPAVFFSTFNAYSSNQVGELFFHWNWIGGLLAVYIFFSNSQSTTPCPYLSATSSHFGPSFCFVYWKKTFRPARFWNLCASIECIGTLATTLEWADPSFFKWIYLSKNFLCLNFKSLKIIMFS